MVEQVKTRFPVTADFGEKIYVGLGNCNLLEVEFTTGRGTWTYKTN